MPILGHKQLAPKCLPVHFLKWGHAKLLFCVKREGRDGQIRYEDICLSPPQELLINVS